MTSDLLHVPHFADLLQRIRPRTVLDFGVRDGLWPRIIRRRVAPADGVHCRVEAALLGGGFVPESVTAEYDRLLHLVDVSQAAGCITAYDVILLESALCAMPRSAGRALLALCVERAQYVLVCVPLEGPTENGPTAWEDVEFAGFPVLQRVHMRGADDRLQGWYLLSRFDPLGVGGPAFESRSEPLPLPAAAALPRNIQHLIDRTRELKAELRYVRQHGAHRLAERIRRSPLWRMVRWIRGRDQEVVVRALGSHTAESQGVEVWLLHAAAHAGGDGVPWDFVTLDGNWKRHATQDSPKGECLLGYDGTLRIPTDDDPELRLLAYPWGGEAEIAFRGRRERIDLYAPSARVVRVFPARTPMTESTAPAAVARGPIDAGAQAPETSPRQTFVEGCRALRASVALVRSSDSNGAADGLGRLFAQEWELPPAAGGEAHDARSVDACCNALLEAGVRHVVFAGGDAAQFAVFQRLRKQDSRIRCDLLWREHFVQFSDDRSWHRLECWIEAARAGTLYSVSTLKAGMERFLATVGVRSFLLHEPPPDPETPAAPPADGVHVGMWLPAEAWKSPFPMLAALALVPGARLHAGGLDRRARDVLGFFEIPLAQSREHVPVGAELRAALRGTHATLHVTFCECCPRTALESFAAGVPCLIGPSSHLFADDPWLRERLIAPFPDRPDVIAGSLRRVLEEREEIMRRYQPYATEYASAAQAALSRFLEG